MLILEKNSFNRKDKVTNIGFLVSLGIILLTFLVLPLLLRAAGVPRLHPLLQVLLPALITLPALAAALFFAGRRGNLLRKLKLTDWHPRHIPVSFAAAAVLLVAMADIINFYHKLLLLLKINAPHPAIEAILKNSRGISLAGLSFGIIVLAPLTEELVFRRFIFGFLAPRCGFLTALVLTSGIFAVIHFSLYSLPALFFLGIAFQLIYLKFGSLYPAILMHSFNNAIALTVLLLFPQLQF
ncbi:MAG: CPBP family intramembrane metalloprotease [Victivallaceae bacterium]|nr:CPBP family intramembrane metalloprotease [Victivallaceae bacterium]